MFQICVLYIQKNGDNVTSARAITCREWISNRLSVETAKTDQFSDFFFVFSMVLIIVSRGFLSSLRGISLDEEKDPSL